MDDNSRRKAALERAAATLQIAGKAFLVALDGDLRNVAVWDITRAVCEEVRDACEATREFCEMLANDGIKFWEAWERCCAARETVLVAETLEAFDGFTEELNVLWHLCEDLHWGAMRELKKCVLPENGLTSLGE